MEKIIRSICCFIRTPDRRATKRLNDLSSRFSEHDYLVQTKRLCAPVSIADLDRITEDRPQFMSVGSLTYDKAVDQFPAFFASKNLSFNVDLTGTTLERKHADLLFTIIGREPRKTFNFAYVFGNVPSSPYFPSAAYERDGFSIGLQSTNLAEGCKTLDEWLGRMRETWDEIMTLCKSDSDFLGIDSSVAPLFNDDGSLIQFIRRLGLLFPETVTTDFYVTITKFLKEHNPKPVGLCGLMFPCLEDFALAEEYDNGEFTIERNLFLSLHSGLGIDTYPIGVDEKPERVLEILKLVQALSKKHSKPLSVRFVSDGKTKIGKKTSVDSPYLTDVRVRGL